MVTKKQDPMLRPREVSELLNVSYSKVIDFIASGEFPNAINVGGEAHGARYRIPESDVDRFLESRRIQRWW